MSNYTPGPCEIIDLYEADLLNEARPRREEVWEIGNREAGRTSGYATNRADAVLFATAPELLEAIEGEIINQRGLIAQFELSPRNGYQAVDAYSIRDDGTRESSGVDRNVGCGTSLECFHYMRSYYYGLCNNQHRYPL